MGKQVVIFGNHQKADFGYLKKAADDIGLVLKPNGGDYNNHHLYHTTHPNRVQQYPKWVAGMPDVLGPQDALTVQHLIGVPHYATAEEMTENLDHAARVMTLGEIGMIAHGENNYTFPDDDGIWTPHGFLRTVDALTDADSSRFGWLQNSLQKKFAEQLILDGKGEVTEEEKKEL